MKKFYTTLEGCTSSVFQGCLFFFTILTCLTIAMDIFFKALPDATLGRTLAMMSQAEPVQVERLVEYAHSQTRLELMRGASDLQLPLTPWPFIDNDMLQAGSLAHCDIQNRIANISGVPRPSTVHECADDLMYGLNKITNFYSFFFYALFFSLLLMAIRKVRGTRKNKAQVNSINTKQL